jgi:hypothetical protein
MLSHPSLKDKGETRVGQPPRKLNRLFSDIFFAQKGRMMLWELIQVHLSIGVMLAAIWTMELKWKLSGQMD